MAHKARRTRISTQGCMVAWSVVWRQIKHADTSPRRVLYNYLVAMVFAFYASRLSNFVGDEIAPKLWANEREEFAKQVREFKDTALLPS
ncbi:MAG: hypothetical protein JO139_04915 [Alphaproteobacteria bacterium]|nr:hypothetical protein [Alphaproteobacteria bacterium]